MVKKKALPTKRDPTRTLTLRKKFIRDISKRFRKFKRDVTDLVVTRDVFGLTKEETNFQRLVGNTKYWAVILNITSPITKAAIKTLQTTIDTEGVEFESEPHITIRYGLEEATVSQLQQLIDTGNGIYFKFSRLSVFENEDKDVLYLEIESQTLTNMHNLLGILPNTQTHDTYRAHLTIGYFPPGTARQWLDKLHNNLYNQSFYSGYEVVLSSPERKQETIVANTGEWSFLSDEAKLLEFENWIQEETGLTIVPEEDRFWEDYVIDGYEKGAGRAFTDINKSKAGSFIVGGKREFISGMLGAPETVNKVKLLAARTLTDLKGVSEVLATQLRKELVDGLVQGQNPRQIARNISARLITSRKSAERIARTEIIRAHAEGQLDALERLGIEEVGVAVEWSTAGDDRVCPLCSPMEGVVFKIKEAHGLIPRHPNCRCSFIPTNVGESKVGQIRSRTGILSRIRESATRSNRGWIGTTKVISKKRPVEKV